MSARMPHLPARAGCDRNEDEDAVARGLVPFSTLRAFHAPTYAASTATPPSSVHPPRALLPPRFPVPTTFPLSLVYPLLFPALFPSFLPPPTLHPLPIHLSSLALSLLPVAHNADTLGRMADAGRDRGDANPRRRKAGQSLTTQPKPPKLPSNLRRGPRFLPYGPSLNSAQLMLTEEKVRTPTGVRVYGRVPYEAAAHHHQLRALVVFATSESAPAAAHPEPRTQHHAQHHSQHQHQQGQALCLATVAEMRRSSGTRIPLLLNAMRRPLLRAPGFFPLQTSNLNGKMTSPTRYGGMGTRSKRAPPPVT
ncbi:hypothetical protein C8J57DRAFT_1524137 [Mycena rebaudengoi]|nr:hypothetical protein C8J57DRAFT_1524137 [Mycena rebaudengoi]